MSQMSPPISSYSSQERGKLPDISHEINASVEGLLEQVGMANIEMPVIWVNPQGQNFFLPAKVDAFVNLNKPNAKGIHMSRLYLALQIGTTKEPLGLVTLKNILSNFVSSQEGLSDSAYIKVRFDMPVERKALVSDERGWRQYPVEMEARLIKSQFEFVISGTVKYSSTCPCSAALSRQLISEQFEEDFASLNSIPKERVMDWLTKDSSIVATPHAQRSLAEFKIKFSGDGEGSSPLEWIDLIEDSLATPVQAAVKREDEQEFARLNGQNLMFCEDAGRKVKHALEQDDRVLGYHVKLQHKESLHPHDAVSVIAKGFEV